MCSCLPVIPSIHDLVVVGQIQYVRHLLEVVEQVHFSASLIHIKAKFTQDLPTIEIRYGRHGKLPGNCGLHSY